jgi:hypothetical protein
MNDENRDLTAVITSAVAGIVGIPAFLLQRAPDCHIIDAFIRRIIGRKGCVFPLPGPSRLVFMARFHDEKRLWGYEED